MDPFMVGRVVHEILLEGNYSGLKKLDQETRRAVEVIVVTMLKGFKIAVEPGMLVMDVRPISYGKLYTVKSIKTVKWGNGFMDVVVMKQNGVTLRLDQFQMRVN